MPIDSADSTRLKSDTATDMGDKVLRWFVQIGAAVIKLTKYFWRTRYPASDEKRAGSVLEEAGAITAATENVVANLTTTKSFTVPVTTGVKVDSDAQINSAALTVLDQEEIQRRRNLVRMSFNDFWSGVYEKPAAFVERLDQAEDYLNERLAASGESWQLDVKTRVALGLPPRSNTPNSKNRAARD
jgi:3-deoxy-D-manno-octulosonate 8-phosphate phosphatase KdsC-like HAD superfamily phosphatase